MRNNLWKRMMELANRAASHDFCSVEPKPHHFYTTLNGSSVYVLGIDKDGDALAVVLRGGHGIRDKRGGHPGEVFMLNDEGAYLHGAGVELGLNLVEQLDAVTLPTPKEELQHPILARTDDEQNALLQALLQHLS